MQRNQLSEIVTCNIKPERNFQFKRTGKKCCAEGTTHLLERIYEKSDAAYETTIGYLRQEGLLGNVRYAIVDSGWVGTIQKSMQTLLAQEKPGITLTGYYFGLYEYPVNRNNCRYEAYYFMPKGNVRKRQDSVTVFLK